MPGVVLSGQRRIDMAAETEDVLVVVFDGKGARFLRRWPNGRLELLNVMQSELQRRTSDAVSDRQGRTFASAGGGIRSPYEPEHDPHKMEKHDLVHRIVKQLDDAFDRNEYKHLVVVAPERTIGEFRSLAPDKIRRIVWREVPKELTQLSVHELESRLNDALKPQGTVS
jgi:protein required for attachment to host cells